MTVPSNKGPIIASFSFSFILLIAVCYLLISRPRIAYVRSLELVYSFNGMKQAHADFTSQTSNWQANIDTLRLKYESLKSEYQNEYSSLSTEQRKDREALIARTERDFKNYTSVIQQQAQEKEKELTQSVLNQINSYVEEYAKRQGYDLVLGAQSNGSVLYAKDGYDITDDVLKELNKSYKELPAEEPSHTSR